MLFDCDILIGPVNHEYDIVDPVGCDVVQMFEINNSMVIELVIVHKLLHIQCKFAMIKPKNTTNISEKHK